MRQLDLDVTYTDGSVTRAHAGVTDVVAFELRYDRSITPLLASGAAAARLFLAWNYLRRTEGEKRPFDEWIEAVDRIRDVAPEKGTDAGQPDEGEAADPTTEAAPTPN